MNYVQRSLRRLALAGSAPAPSWPGAIQDLYRGSCQDEQEILNRARRPHRDIAVCLDCKTEHRLHARNRIQLLARWSDWKEKHKGHRIGLRYPCRFDPSFYGLRPNANVNIAYQAEQTITSTSWQSLASSATAGWQSAFVDNTTNLYLDYGVQSVIAAVNTAPANDKAVYLFAYGGDNSTDLTTSGAAANPGTQGTLTFPNVTTSPIVMPLLGAIPYTTQNVAFTSRWFSISKAFDFVQPPFWGIAALNFTGMTLAASGNTFKYRGNYLTIV